MMSHIKELEAYAEEQRLAAMLAEGADLRARVERIQEILIDASIDDGEARLLIAGVLDGRVAVIDSEEP